MKKLWQTKDMEEYMRTKKIEIEPKKPLTDEEIEAEYIQWLKEIEQNGD